MKNAIYPLLAAADMPERSNAAHLLKIVLGAALACGAPIAQAHPDGLEAGGFAAGFLHPLGGLDHLLAMVAVGIWAASMVRPLLWALPVAFPLLMVVGGALGIAGVSLPFIEPGIAASVLVLGLAILVGWRAPVSAALAIVGFFGVLHGYAHGLELPQAAAPLAYTAGFVVATSLLHLAGIAFGLFVLLPLGTRIVRTAGAAIAAAGVWLLVGMSGIV